MSIPKLKNKLRDVFNKYIRLRDVDENGYGTCISCGNPLRYKTPNAQAGHYYPAPIEILRFNEMNVNLQCKGCNHFKSGNLIEYRKGLIRKYDGDAVQALDVLADYYKAHGHRWDRFTLETKIKEYQEKILKIAKSKMFKI